MRNRIVLIQNVHTTFNKIVLTHVQKFAFVYQFNTIISHFFEKKKQIIIILKKNFFMRITLYVPNDYKFL